MNGYGCNPICPIKRVNGCRPLIRSLHEADSRNLGVVASHWLRILGSLRCREVGLEMRAGRRGERPFLSERKIRHDLPACQRAEGWSGPRLCSLGIPSSVVHAVRCRAQRQFPRRSSASSRHLDCLVGRGIERPPTGLLECRQADGRRSGPKSTAIESGKWIGGMRHGIVRRDCSRRGHDASRDLADLSRSRRA